MKRNYWLFGVLALLVGVVVAYAASGDLQTWTGAGSRRNTVEFKIATPTMGSAAKFVPGANNTNALGTSALQFSDVRTVNATVSGTLSATGSLVPAIIDVTTSTPTVVGALCMTSAYVLYIATQTSTYGGWVKVGSQ